MAIYSSLTKRRSYYKISKDLPVDEDEVVKTIQGITRLVPDAFDMKSQRLVIALGKKHDQLWDAAYDAFGGKVAREKMDSFKAGAGTVLFFSNDDVIDNLRRQFPRYAENFPVWAQQSNGMLQLSVWCALRDLGIGANLQHYNPVIDDSVRRLFALPSSWRLVAEMPFGGIVEEPEPKEHEDVRERVYVSR